MADFEVEGSACPQCGGPLATLEDQSLEGQTIDGRYEIVGIIGKGGMGVVYRAKHRYLKRDVALKVLRRDVAHDSASVKRFLQEAQVISTLSSPHTVTVHDFGVTPDGRTYFVMELMEGESLADLLERSELLEWRDALQIALEACDSLGEAHSKNIFHRDVKPDNLFLVPLPDGGRRVKMLDFGIARLGDSPEKFTATGLICGTPQYISPEQGQGAEADHRSDLYSLGVVLFEMLAGTPPFHDETPVRTVYAHVTKPAPELDVVKPGSVFPQSVKLLVRWAMEKLPGDRPQSAREFARGLKLALEEDDETAVSHILAIAEALRVPVQAERVDLGGEATRERLASESTEDPEETTDEEETSLDAPTQIKALYAEDLEATRPADFSPSRPPGRGSWWLLAAALVLLVLGAVAFLGPWNQSREEPVSGVSTDGPAAGGAVGEPVDAGRTDLHVAGVPDAGPADDKSDVVATVDVADAKADSGSVDVETGESGPVHDAVGADEVNPGSRDATFHAVEIRTEVTGAGKPDTVASDSSGTVGGGPDAVAGKEERKRRERERKRLEKERSERERKEKERKEKEQKEKGQKEKPSGNEYETIPVNPDGKKPAGEYDDLP